MLLPINLQPSLPLLSLAEPELPLGSFAASGRMGAQHRRAAPKGAAPAPRNAPSGARADAAAQRASAHSQS